MLNRHVQYVAVFLFMNATVTSARFWQWSEMVEKDFGLSLWGCFYVLILTDWKPIVHDLTVLKAQIYLN